MDKERILYNKLVDKFLERLDDEPTHQELKIIHEFLKDNDIKALDNKHQGLTTLKDKVVNFPFSEEEIEEALEN